MVYPECLNGRCTYNDDYRCKAEGISEDIICQQGKDDALSQVIKPEPGGDDLQVMITKGRKEKRADTENLGSETA